MTPATPSVAGVAATVLDTVLIAAAAVWGGLAFWYRLPGGTAVRTIGVIGWAGFSTAASMALWQAHWVLGPAAFCAGFAAVLVWWTRLAPVHDGAWADDVARMTTGTIEGNRVTLHNVRNFEWRSAADFTPRWETRTYDLDALRSADMIMSYWRGPAIAHLLISFGFDGGAQVVFSVEIRRKKLQQFSEIGGFFKEFELCVIAADELDVVRLRTDARGERVYLYRLCLEPSALRQLFLGYVGEANALVRAPRFYNTITVNCTTLVYRMMNRIVGGGLPLSHRLLFSGYMPEYVYGIGGLDRRFSLEELRAGGYVGERGRRSTGDGNYSTDIRRGVPGIG